MDGNGEQLTFAINKTAVWRFIDRVKDLQQKYRVLWTDIDCKMLQIMHMHMLFKTFKICDLPRLSFYFFSLDHFSDADALVTIKGNRQDAENAKQQVLDTERVFLDENAKASSINNDVPNPVENFEQCLSEYYPGKFINFIFFCFHFWKRTE